MWVHWHSKMKVAYKYALILTVASFLVSACSKAEAGEEDVPQYCQQFKNLEMPSKYVQGGVVKYNVLTPPGFREDGGEKYCVIYLLHGAGDDNNAWLSSPQDRGGQKSLASQMLSAVQDGTIPKTVVVMPDAGMSFYMGEFEDFFYKEMLPEVEKKFCVDSRRGCRAVAGLSMGGFGAAYYALKYPDMYCYAYTMSMAAFEPLYSLAAGQKDKSVFPHITIVNGNSDATVGKAPDEFYAYIKELGLDCDFENWYGTHDWRFWGECIPKFLSRIGAEFKNTVKN